MPRPKKTKEVEDYEKTLQWIVERIDEEADRAFDGKKSNWKKAIIEISNEAYGALNRWDKMK